MQWPRVQWLNSHMTTLAGRHRMRCSKCTGRFTLKQHPSKYAKEVKCPHCSADTVYSCEASRRREVTKRKNEGSQCHCANYPFPHAAGSFEFCIHSEAMQVAGFPTKEQEHAYQRVIETPRGA